MKSYYLRNSAVVVSVLAFLLAGFKIGSHKNFTSNGINEFTIVTSNEPATVQCELLADNEQLQVDDYDKECTDTDKFVETSVDHLDECDDEELGVFRLSLDDVLEVVEMYFETESAQIIKEIEDETSAEDGSIETNFAETSPRIVSEFQEMNSVDTESDPTEFNKITPEYDVLDYKEPSSTWVRYYTDSQYAEYPVACQVWQILRSWGWNEAVSSGIIGNMMTECGGLTLDLDWDLYDNTWMFYGLCMWSLKWAPETAGLSIEGQMQYLYDTIEVNMDYFGGNFQEFLSITDPGYAALYFQWYYEVGLNSETRYAGALEAYEYFRSK